MWLSLNPGNTVAPCASTVTVCGRRSRLISRLLPTRRILFPRTATASANAPSLAV